MNTRLAVLVSSFGYCGFFPVAPGTAGSAAALLLYALARWAGASPLAETLVIVVVAIAGVWSASEAERHFGRTDRGQIVIDEALGMLMTLAFLPLSWTGVLLGFFVFRALDSSSRFPPTSPSGCTADWA